MILFVWTLLRMYSPRMWLTASCEMSGRVAVFLILIRRGQINLAGNDLADESRKDTSILIADDAADYIALTGEMPITPVLP
jgi:hypothetical protein